MSASANARPNRLAQEKSPYLLQHAYNPVDWFPWGDEAFNKAQSEDKMIFLSIGYATCHWCHVMERESFENPDLAKKLNDQFVPIKVDREELPDVDQIYMKSLQAMGQQGGWPLNVFLTPDLRPVTGGTYFPPQPAFGRPSFGQVLDTISDVWQNNREKILESATALTDFLKSTNRATTEGDVENVAPPGMMVGIKAVDLFFQSFDAYRGGFTTNGNNKFPPSMAMLLLIRQYDRNQDKRCLQMVETTLSAMKRGGIYDQIGGGLCRYATDHDWLVPHFEKMLYDNALFIMALLEAYRVTGKQEYADWAEDCIEYIRRDMTDPAGPFYSAEDADSEGEEGKFYVWSEQEFLEVLEEAGLALEDRKRILRYWGLSARGNFEGKNILHVPVPPEEFGVDDRFLDKLTKARKALLSRRARRERPLRDDKVLTSWNGLMISALSLAGRLLEKPEYTLRARKAADFILENLMEDGMLYRRFRDGEKRYAGTLSDYSLFGCGLMDLYRSCGQAKYLLKANELAERMVRDFKPENPSAFYESPPEQKELLVRPIEGYDGVIPSGNSAATRLLLSLSLYGFSSADYRKWATHILNHFKGALFEYPQAHPFMCLSLFLIHDPAEEIAVTSGVAATSGKTAASASPSENGQVQDEAFHKMLQFLWKKSHPDRIFAYYPPAPLDESRERSESDEGIAARIPLLEGRLDKKSAARGFICKDLACEAPVTDAEQFILKLQ
ncbi:MAG: thioredoxin domain-containing protein [Spirochaetaceae bacterium]|nr:thioredoxin domain-containing protein [Spirochaetaceae bacterium]|tara:strand:+ start:13418 stop:15598 length:2181 start_codon:yes stop_codon:yes gene_type:complete